MARDQMLWVEALGAGMDVGERAGNRFTTWNLNRRADKLRNEIETEAKARGVDPEQLMAEYEPRLQELAAGARRRGLTDRSGRALSETILEGVSEDWGRAAERRAWEMQQKGDFAGARDERAQSLGARGQFDQGVAQQLQGQTIRDTTGAIGKRPRLDAQGKAMVDAQGQPVMEEFYNPAKGAAAQSLTAARYGDPGAAAQNVQNERSFRLEGLRANSNALFAMLHNPENFTNDQVRGAFQAVKEFSPELQAMDLVKGDDNVLYLYTNGQPSGSLDPKNKADADEITQMVNLVSKDPGAAVNEYMNAKIKAAQDAKAQDTKVGDEFRTARIKLAEKLADAGLDADTSEKVISTKSMFSGGPDSNGMKMINLTEPGTYAMEVGGKNYIVKTLTPEELEKGEGGDAIQWFKMDGKTPVAPPKGAAMSQEQQSALLDLSSALAGQKRKGAVAAINSAYRTLDALERGERGDRAVQFGSPVSEDGGEGARRAKGGTRADRNNNPGNIRDVGQFKNSPGYLGKDKDGFARFDSPEAGIQAMQEQLARYVKGTEATGGVPKDTIAGIVETWAPASDNNDVAAYVAAVSKATGFDPNQKLGEGDLMQVAQAMARHEGWSGGGGSEAQEPQVPQAPTPSEPSKPSPSQINPNRVAEQSEWGKRAAGHQKQATRLRELNRQIAEGENYIEEFSRQYRDQIKPVASSGRGDTPTTYRQASTPEAREFAQLNEALQTLKDEREQLTTSATKAAGATKTALRAQELREQRRARLGASADFFE